MEQKLRLMEQVGKGQDGAPGEFGEQLAWPNQREQNPEVELIEKLGLEDVPHTQVKTKPFLNHPYIISVVHRSCHPSLAEALNHVLNKLLKYPKPRLEIDPSELALPFGDAKKTPQPIPRRRDFQDTAAQWYFSILVVSWSRGAFTGPYATPW